MTINKVLFKNLSAVISIYKGGSENESKSSENFVSEVMNGEGIATP